MPNFEEINILGSLQPELAILIPVCWGVGFIVKSSKIKNKYIPLILSIFSVVMAALYTFAINGITNVLMSIFLSIAQGIAYWIIAWVSYEKIIKNAMKKAKKQTKEKQDDGDE